ncbi:MAG TPA: hypothetical protein VF556_09080 [Pyrinomonadaceae bacterium]|jgi:hypothetical protein
MLKIILVLLIVIELALVPLMIVCLSGVNVVLPGLGLVIGGGVLFVMLLIFEAILVFITLILYRIIRADSGKYS